MVSSITVSQRSALKRAIRNPSLLPLLIQKISGLQWFDAFEEEGLLNPENNPKPVQSDEKNYFRIPPWAVAEYLVSSSVVLKEEQYLLYAKRYLQVIRNTTRYAIDEGFGNYRTWWQFSKILKNLPPELIVLEDVNLFEFWLNDRFESGIILDEIAKWILAILDDADEHIKEVIVALLEKIYKCQYKQKKWGAENSIEAEFSFREYSFVQFIEKTSFKLGFSIGFDVVHLLQYRFEDILESQKDDAYSMIWRPAVEEHSQNFSSRNAGGLVLTALREALLGFCESDLSVAESYICSLLQGKYQTTKRVAIFVAGKKYDELSSEVISIILNYEFFNYKFRHELWHFLFDNFDKFTVHQKNIVISIIENIALNDDNGNYNEKFTAFEKINWLMAIKDKNETANLMYEKVLAVTKSIPEHPDFSSYMSTSWGGHKSEISAADMAGMGIEVLVRTLNSYKAQRSEFGGSDLDGLAKEFRLYVKANPLIVIDNITQLGGLKYFLLYELIEGYYELWSNKEELQLDWDKIWISLLLFFDALVSGSQFFCEAISDGNESEFDYYKMWIVGAIGNFLESGCRSDNHAFSVELIGPVKLLLQKLLSHKIGAEFQEDSDAVSVAINSPRGKCIEALIKLSLFACRKLSNDGKAHDFIWKEYEPLYDEELKKADHGEYEFAALATEYIHNFIFMSENWVINNLPKLFYVSNNLAWLFSVQGYSYVKWFNVRIYTFLKENGFLLKILNEIKFKDNVREHYVQLIVYSYLHEIEFLNQKDCMVKVLLDRMQINELCQLIQFVRSQLKYDGSDIQKTEKVFELWPLLLKIMDNDFSEKDKLASRLCNWSVFIDKLEGDQLNWLLKVAPYANYDHNAHELLNDLARLSAGFPIPAGDVWLAMLQSNLFDYPEDSIVKILRDLSNAGKPGLVKAKEIVAKYLENGYQRPMRWLQEIQAH